MHSPGGWNPFARLSGRGRPVEDVDLPLPNPGWLVGSLVSAVEWAGFWLAVLLPVVYLPVLFTGFGSTVETVAFVGLLVLHALSLRVGYAHAPGGE